MDDDILDSDDLDDPDPLDTPADDEDEQFLGWAAGTWATDDDFFDWLFG
jgi:hypothetical protein